MRRVLALAVIVFAVVSLYATTAPAGEQAVTPKQFSALQKRVVKLEKDNKVIIGALNFVIACGFDQGAIPTTKVPQYHVTATGETTDFYVLTTSNADCVNVINSPLVRRFLRHQH
jgi:hypothetical protein